MCPLVSDAVSDLNLHLKTLNGETNLNVCWGGGKLSHWCWVTLSVAAVVAQVDKYAEIDYSMVSAPTVSNTSIDLNLRVNVPTAWWVLHKPLPSLWIFSLLRESFTPSGNIVSLRSPPQPFFSPLPPTTCCTWPSRPSRPTRQPLSTTRWERSACTSLMTWYAAFSSGLLRLRLLDHDPQPALTLQIPPSSPLRLDTRTFGAFIPQVTETEQIFYKML